MNYYVVTDIEGYVQVIKHTNSKMDFIELDLEKYDLTEDRIHAYKLGKNELIFDEEKYKQILDEKQKATDEKEVKSLTEQLKATDEDMLGFLEDMFSLKNPLTFVSDLFTLMKKYSMLVVARQQIRERIKELQHDND